MKKHLCVNGKKKRYEYHLKYERKAGIDRAHNLTTESHDMKTRTPTPSTRPDCTIACGRVRNPVPTM